MRLAEGVLTARGGMTSHAALVGRQMGKVCVVGCADLDIDYAGGTLLDPTITEATLSAFDHGLFAGVSFSL